MELPRQGVELELELLAYATATATPYPSRMKPMLQLVAMASLSEARDQTCILTDTSQVLNLLNQNGNSEILF